MTPILHLARGTISMCVHAALEEANLPYRLHWVDFAAGQQRAPDYLAVNPKGRVPALVTDRGVLTETPALLEWIAGIATPRLMPSDPWLAARVRETMSYLASTVHVAHAHKMRGSRWADDPGAHDAMRDKVTSNIADCAAYLDAQLDGDWVGRAFGVADLYLWNVARWFPGDGVPLDAFPRLHAHHDRVAARPAVARVIALHTAD